MKLKFVSILVVSRSWIFHNFDLHPGMVCCHNSDIRSVRCSMSVQPEFVFYWMKYLLLLFTIIKGPTYHTWKHPTPSWSLDVKRKRNWASVWRLNFAIGGGREWFLPLGLGFSVWFFWSIPDEAPTSPPKKVFHNINDVRGMFWSQERLQNSTARKEKELCPREDFRFFGRCEHLALLQSSVPTGMERPLVCMKPPFTEKLNVDMAGWWPDVVLKIQHINVCKKNLSFPATSATHDGVEVWRVQMYGVPKWTVVDWVLSHHRERL